jgi:RNA polymerase sigma-70 factor, ECF subfamily
LRTAAGFAVPGRFQIEAAIQSLHAAQMMTGAAHTQALLALYDLLITLAPSLGGQVARAGVIAGTGDPSAALALLDALADRCAAYQPWWATRARALHLAGLTDAAHAAAARAAALTDDKAVSDWLLSGALFS